MKWYDDLFEVVLKVGMVSAVSVKILVIIWMLFVFPIANQIDIININLEKIEKKLPVQETKKGDTECQKKQ